MHEGTHHRNLTVDSSDRCGAGFDAITILKEPSMLIELGEFGYRPQQWDRFVSGELWEQWAKDYPNIFDQQDIQIAKNQAGSAMRLHFHEWLAAVLIFHTYGYLSLIEQYEFKAQKRK